MLFSNQRDQLRQFYFDVWGKYQTKAELNALEQQVLAVMLEHPEYHALLDDPELNLDKDFTPEMGQSNPFLHMALHLSVREQASTNRPEGITAIYQNLITKFQGQQLEAEHLMLECLAEMIWAAQRSGTAPDEQAYLQQLNQALAD